MFIYAAYVLNEPLSFKRLQDTNAAITIFVSLTDNFLTFDAFKRLKETLTDKHIGLSKKQFYFYVFS